MNKRDRVLTTLELDEPDKIPIHYLGFERTCTAWQHFKKTREYRKLKWSLYPEIIQPRFMNVDVYSYDIFPKLKPKMSTPAPGKKHVTYDRYGKLHETGINPRTGLRYRWHIGSYFTKEEIIREYWNKHGKPTEWLMSGSFYKRSRWERHVKRVSKYFYPMSGLGIAMFEACFEGIGPAAMSKFMRKKPQFFHEIMREYTNVNLELLKRSIDAGSDIVFYFDDLGQKGRTILSLKNFREFILPYYKEIYQLARKRSVFLVQHSCGLVDPFLPDMADAGLHCIQALEPAAGTNLAYLKETLGDKLAFMGGMDSTNVLNFGTPKDVEEDVKNCIKAAAEGGGYFAGPSHNIMDVPWENMEALRSSLHKYREYPLNF